MKIGVIGDIHLKDSLGYSDYIADRRTSEKKKIFDTIVEKFSSCGLIIFMGDQLNGRNNPSEVIREFVELLERFDKQEIVVLAGNHEKSGDGKTAVDFLKEVKKDNWTIVNDSIETSKDKKFVYCPYFYKGELGLKTDASAAKKVMSQLKSAKILFVHQAISDTMVNGTTTNLFKEIILPKNELEKKYQLVVGGHIHSPQTEGRTIITGSVINQEVGEHEKYIWRIDSTTMKVEQIKLPGRGIYKLENPTLEQIAEIDDGNIVKVILTEKISKDKVDEIREKIERFDAHLLLEQYPTERRKTVVADNLLDYTVVQLLEVYANEKKIDINKLKSAFELVKV